MTFSGVRIVTIVVIAVFVSSQTTPSGSAGTLVNPLAGTIKPYPAASTTLPGFLKDLASAIKGVNSTVTTSFGSGAVAPTGTSAENFGKAVTAIKNWVKEVVKVNEPGWYTASYLVSKVSPFHLSQFANFTKEYDRNMAVLALISARITNNDNNVINDVQVLRDTLPDFTSDFKAMQNRANALLQSTLPLQKNYTTNATLITDRLKKLNGSAVLSLNNAIAHKARAQANITTLIQTNLTAIAKVIENVKGNYQAYLTKLQSTGAQQMVQFNATVQAICTPLEQTLQRTKENLDIFDRFIERSRTSNANLMTNFVNNGIDRIKRLYSKAKMDYVFAASAVSQIIDSKSPMYITGTEKITELKPKIQLILTKIGEFVAAQKTAIGAKNSELAGMSSLASIQTLQAKITEAVGNVTMVAAGPNFSRQEVIPLSQTSLAMVSSSNPQKYLLKFNQAAPQLPTLTSFPAPLLTSEEIAPHTQTEFTMPSGLDTPDGPECPATVPETVKFPAPFSPYPCFDSGFISQYYVTQTPLIDGSWVRFSLDISRHNFAVPPAAMVNVSFKNLPGASLQLSTPRTFTPNTPTLASRISMPTTTSNGWNNFILASSFETSRKGIDVLILVTDVQEAIKAGLTARVAYLGL